MRGTRAALAAVIAAAALLGAAKPTPVPITEQIKHTQDVLNRTQVKVHNTRLKVRQARYKVLSISQQLNDTNGNIARVNDTLDGLDRSIRQIELRLGIRRHQLESTRASLYRHRTALNGRLVDVYEYGPVSYVDVLLASTSFADFVVRWDFMRAIIKSDSILISGINTEQTKYEHLVSGLEQTQAQLVAAQDEKRTEEGQLSALADERRQLLGVAQQQRNVIAQQLVELEGLTAQEEARLQALIVEKQREDYLATLAARRAAQAARRAAAIAAGLPPPPESPLGGPVSFIWPVRGPITSPFGMRTDPVTGRYALHSGIDIGVDYGTPIRAAADGLIIYVGWYGGYGNLITIDNGDSYSTLYAHCSAMYVSVNQRVQRGQVIGAVGATGYATGPHLHFEIRKNGVPIDPLGKL
jgi:murein DD-endopeptidase MepM/ murein hydrolase activator NlpD